MAPLSSSLVARLRVQLKLSISRLRMTQQRDMALAKQQRRAMALLLEQYKVESARIRVENIIRSDIMTELHEVLELYCELLLARSQLLETNMITPSFASSISNATTSALATRKSNASASPAVTKILPDPPSATQDLGLDEAIRSIIFAAPRTDIKELMQVRQLLLEKFGKEVGQQAIEGVGVAERVLKKLKVETPAKSLVDAYLREIARTYGIAWSTDAEDEDEDEDEDEGEGSNDSVHDDDEPGSGQRVLLGASELKEEEPQRHLEQQSIMCVTPTTESTVVASAASATTDSMPTSRIAEDEQHKEEQFRIRSVSSPPRGDITDNTLVTLRINPPSPRTENAHPQIKLPGLPEEKPSKDKKKKKRKVKRDKTEDAKTIEKGVVKDVDNVDSEAKADDRATGGVHHKSEKVMAGKPKKSRGGIGGTGGTGSAGVDSGPGGKIPDVDELARRFAELKR